MTIQMFLILLTLFSTLTGLLTEGVKKFLDGLNKTYASNIVVLAAAALVGGLGTVVFYLLIGFPFNLINIICIPLMIVANWLGAMVGYDKIKQAILQINFNEKSKGE
jgi:hypothetical protein